MIDISNIVEEYKDLGWAVTFSEYYEAIYFTKNKMKCVFSLTSEVGQKNLETFLLLGSSINLDTFELYYYLFKERIESGGNLWEINLGRFLICQQISNKKEIIEMIKKIAEWDLLVELYHMTNVNISLGIRFKNNISYELLIR
jgi:hypothetical protein